jgi:hypothetical protein
MLHCWRPRHRILLTTTLQWLEATAVITEAEDRRRKLWRSLLPESVEEPGDYWGGATGVASGVPSPIVGARGHRLSSRISVRGLEVQRVTRCLVGYIAPSHE